MHPFLSANAYDFLLQGPRGDTSEGIYGQSEEIRTDYAIPCAGEGSGRDARLLLMFSSSFPASVGGQQKS